MTTQQEAYDAQVEAASERLDDLQKTITQREWLLICRTLDLPREAVVRDGGTRLLALAWIKGKRDHGGAKWEPLLEATDEEMLVIHGFPTEEPSDPDAQVLATYGEVQAATPDQDAAWLPDPGPLLPPRPGSQQ